MSKILWEGSVGPDFMEGAKTRIRSAEEVGPIVECLDSNGKWSADMSDEACGQVYCAAFLEVREALEKLYDRDMGNLNLSSGVDVLRNTGRLLGNED